MKQKRDSNETHKLIKGLGFHDIINLSKMTCKKHSHSYLAHPACAYKDGIVFRGEDGKKKVFKERIGFIDIETFTFAFKADMGFMMSYCIKELNGKLIKNVITPKECALKADNDKRLMVDLISDLQGFTKVIGHYSTFFDMPFLRTRAVYYDLDFPVYKEIYHQDTYFILKRKFSLKSRSLANSCKFFGISAKDHKFDFQLWYNAAKGDKKALNHVLIHNIEDVDSTEALWKKISDFMPKSKASI